MLKLSVALFLIALGLSVSAKPWQHRLRRFRNDRLKPSYIETNDVDNSPILSAAEIPVKKSQATNVEQENEIKANDDDGNESTGTSYENILERIMQVTVKVVEEAIAKKGINVKVYANALEFLENISKDLKEYEEYIRIKGAYIGEKTVVLLVKVFDDILKFRKSVGLATLNQVEDISPIEGDDRKKKFNEYAFQSMKGDLLSSADPEIRGKIQEIFNEYPEPNYADEDNVQEVYEQILNAVNEYKKSKGLETSSKEDDSSSNEVHNSVFSSTAIPIQEQEKESNEKENEDAVDTKKPDEEQENENDVDIKKPDEEQENEDDGDTKKPDEEHENEDDVDAKKPDEEQENEVIDGDDEYDDEDKKVNQIDEDRKKELNKYVFRSLKEDLLNSADPEIRGKIQEILNEYPEPNYADGDNVEKVYQQMLNAVNEYKKSKGLETSSEEDNSSSIEIGDSIPSSTAKPDRAEEHEIDEENEGSEENTIVESGSNNRKNDNYLEPNYADVAEGREVHQKIVKDAAEYEKSKQYEVSNEEDDSSYNED